MKSDVGYNLAVHSWVKGPKEFPYQGPHEYMSKWGNKYNATLLR